MILPTIKRGSNGQLVRYLQDLLNRNGYIVIIDGSFGPATEESVKKLQKDLKLDADGIVGPKTWEAFSKASFSNGKAFDKPTIIEDLIPILDKRRSGKSQTPLWITIHNTGNPNSSALGERGWLLNPNNDRVASWHYAVDQLHAVLVIPENEIAWHAGENTGNTTSIGIEVCESGNQEIVWANAVGLTASLLYKYGWGIDRVTTHNRWSGKDCPRLILKRWNEFLADVEASLDALKNPAPKIPKPIDEIPKEPIEESLPVVDETPPIDTLPVDTTPIEEEHTESVDNPTDDSINYEVLNSVLRLLEALLKKILWRQDN